MSIEKILGESFLFGEFPPDELSRLAQICSQRTLGKGAEIFKEGEHGDALFILEKGRVRIHRVLTESYDETVAVLGPGGVFGEMSFIDRVARSTSAEAAESCVLIQLSRSDFDVILSKQPGLASKVLRQITMLIARRIRSTNESLSTVLQWIEEIRQCSEWSFEHLPRSPRGLEIAIRGLGRFRGRLIHIARMQAGYAFLWENEEGQVSWTPYEALYYLRAAK
jgi:CRP/FNR family transcriptional regulator, cyclic AMP receptor protein